MRRLATVREIREIRPIPDADRIELALVDGWQVVVRKGEFTPGDWGLYFEIDSFLPQHELWEFLEKDGLKTHADGTTGIRLRTRKFRGQISQGLLLPIKIVEDEISWHGLPLDTCLDNTLGIQTWEAPLPTQLAGKAAGSRPDFVPKTDEERIQNRIEWFDKYTNIPMEATEKLDGSSISIFNNEYGNEQGIASRKLSLKLDQEGNTFVDTVHRDHILEILKANITPLKNIVLQGELVGPGIQGNTLGLTQPEIYIYNIFDIQRRRYLTPALRRELLLDLEETADKYGLDHGIIKHVPVLNLGARYACPLQRTIDELLAIAIRPSEFEAATTGAEGIVFKSREYVYGNSFSFKVINNQRLAEHDTDK